MHAALRIGRPQKFSPLLPSHRYVLVKVNFVLPARRSILESRRACRFVSVLMVSCCSRRGRQSVLLITLHPGKLCVETALRMDGRDSEHAMRLKLSTSHSSRSLSRFPPNWTINLGIAEPRQRDAILIRGTWVF